MTTIQEAFQDLPEYRREKSIIYPISEILHISLCAIICGAETWENIREFGNSKTEWLKQYLKLDNGIPSSDTFKRFFSNICADKFEECFGKWINDLVTIKMGEVISLDGKTLRGAKEYRSKSMVHMVSSWANEAEVSLGQVKVGEKTNEITAIPELLRVLDIEGCFVTIDAMGTQTNIASMIDDMDGFYVLAVKENQKELYDNIIDSFKFIPSQDNDETLDSGHGRIETRKCTVITNMTHIERTSRWVNLSSIIKIASERYIKASGKVEKSTRYYISNSDSKAKIFNTIIRKHWAVENNLHWQLDVTFNEDKQRKRIGNASQNFSTANKIAMTL